MNVLNNNHHAAGLRRLLPYRRFFVETDLSPRQIAERLCAELPQSVGDWFSHDGWRGRASESAFWFRRNALRRPTPIVEGRLLPTSLGTRVEVTIRPSWPSVAMFVFLALFPLLLAAYGLAPLAETPIPAVVMAALVTIGFLVEERRAVTFLTAQLF